MVRMNEYGGFSGVWTGRRRPRKKVRMENVVCALLLTWFLLGMLLTPLLELAVLPQGAQDGGPVSTTADVSLLREEVWIDLTLAERMDVLEWIAAVEGDALGLPFAVQVTEGELEDRVQGTYRNQERQITMSRKLVRNGSTLEVLDTLAHELYHAYQYCVVELYQKNEAYQDLLLFSAANAEVYCREFENYQSGTEGGFSEYFNQQVEIDARAFAREICEKYGELQNVPEGLFPQMVAAGQQIEKKISL